MRAASFKCVLADRPASLKQELVAARQHGKKLECESLCPNEEKQKARTGSHRQDGINE